ncbi:DNA polymerase IV [Algicella marina]|uniref:DNA polymerase IV n=1 Tax=Algicella marina TaxID=2683284 RepID=A0A6P1T4C0_9RHOB|nr:DNA polymerase IV [Algicella marina]QHQ36109.1 DNA polymerase IV [Algicella marina]
MNSLCRDCLSTEPPKGRRCRKCGSPRLLTHTELGSLSIAHMDCDAFYASVEKRDNPDLRDKPVIIGGGKRGVVSTACYIARIKGVRSAMPMFKALALCPEAVVVKPRMEKYVEVSREIRSLMEELTPVIEPLSLDEAFLDLTGTERLHGAPPSLMMAQLVRRIEQELGVSASVGLSHNKFLAKIASDLDKPRGFSVIGVAETDDFLSRQNVSVIWGVGRAFRETLERDGIRTIADLKRRERKSLAERYGAMGDRLWHLARGQDSRRVSSRSDTKSISNETTFSEDTIDPDLLEGHLWRLGENVSDRAKAKDLAGRVVALKLKRSNHSSLSRRITLPEPTQLAHVIFDAAKPLLERSISEGPFRLIGVSLTNLTAGSEADTSPDLLDASAKARTAAERATDAIRDRFGKDAILKGRSLR